MSLWRWLFGPAEEDLSPTADLVPALLELEQWLLAVNDEPDKSQVTAYSTAVATVINDLNQLVSGQQFASLGMGEFALALSRELSRMLTLALTGELRSELTVALQKGQARMSSRKTHR